VHRQAPRRGRSVVVGVARRLLRRVEESPRRGVGECENHSVCRMTERNDGGRMEKKDGRHGDKVLEVRE